MLAIIFFCNASTSFFKQVEKGVKAMPREKTLATHRDRTSRRLRTPNFRQPGCLSCAKNALHILHLSSSQLGRGLASFAMVQPSMPSRATTFHLADDASSMAAPRMHRTEQLSSLNRCPQLFCRYSSKMSAFRGAPLMSLPVKYKLST